MKESLFEVLKAEGLTHLEIHYDWKNDKVLLYSAKEWDKDIRWSDYNRKFTQWSLLTENALYYNDKQTRELFDKNGLTGHLEQSHRAYEKGQAYPSRLLLLGKGGCAFYQQYP